MIIDHWIIAMNLTVHHLKLKLVNVMANGQVQCHVGLTIIAMTYAVRVRVGLGSYHYRIIAGYIICIT